MSLKINRVGSKIFLLGMLGVVSLVTVNFPVPSQVATQFSPAEIKLLTLINPTLFLLLATTAGVLANRSMKLRVSSFRGGFRYDRSTLIDIGKKAVLGGIVTGGVLVTLGHLSEQFIGTNKLQELELSLSARLLYGGITEEILLRFGVMTSVAALIYRFVTKNLRMTMVAAIFISTILFAAGHMPVVFATDANPSLGLLSYVLVGNMIAGMFFGTLYWKRGLDYAMIAHMVTHLTMVTVSYAV